MTSRAVGARPSQPSAPTPTTVSSDTAEDLGDGDLDDDALRVLTRLTVALGVAAYGVGDPLGIVAHDRTPLQRGPLPAVGLRNGDRSLSSRPNLASLVRPTRT